MWVFVGTGRCLAANAGTCGDLRFTPVSDGIAWTIEYFDASGTLVAAREGTDVVTNPECAGWSHFGERLTCSEVGYRKLLHQLRRSIRRFVNPSIRKFNSTLCVSVVSEGRR